MSLEDELAAAVRMCEDCGRPFLSDRAFNAHHCSGDNRAKETTLADFAADGGRR